MKTSRRDQFLSTLPQIFESTIQWFGQFKCALNKLIPEVDKIIVSSIVSPLTILDVETAVEAYIIRAGADIREGPKSDPTAMYDVERNDNPVRILRHFARQCDIHQYRTPIVLEMKMHGRYFGLLILLQLRESRPISRASLQVLHDMTDFLRWAYTGTAFRKSYVSPGASVRAALSCQMQNRFGLTRADSAVLALLLSGFSYKTTADKLEITIDTVKKHVKKIYNRASVNSLSELWARYYPERWDGLEVDTAQ